MRNFENSCCFTGYRPEKFNFPFKNDCQEYRTFYSRLVTAISVFVENGCTDFYCGMAPGFDIIAGEHVALIKKLNKKLRLIGVVPFKGQEEKWSDSWKQRYYELLKDCDEVITLNENYTRWCYSQRNQYMVDRSLYVLTYFDGKAGGTKNTLNYASKHGRNILNIYETDPLAEQKARYKCKLILIPPEE